MGRALGIVLGLLLLAGGGLGVLAFVAGRDDAGVTAGPATGPGRAYPDRGAAHERARGARPADLAGLPLSGPHEPVLPSRDRARVPPDALLHALELGNVALLYGGDRPPAALVALQRDVSGAYDPELAAAGQAVLLVRSGALAPGESAAAAWRRGLPTAEDAQLRAFVDAWLGQGAP